jgi:hypothetical protein
VPLSFPFAHRRHRPARTCSSASHPHWWPDHCHPSLDSVEIIRKLQEPLSITGDHRIGASTLTRRCGKPPLPPCCPAPPSFHLRSRATDPVTRTPPTSPHRSRQRGSRGHGDRALGASGAATQAGWAGPGSFGLWARPLLQGHGPDLARYCASWFRFFFVHSFSIRKLQKIV